MKKIVDYEHLTDKYSHFLNITLSSYKGANALITVNQLATTMAEGDGLTPSEVDEVLGRISLDMNCYLYSIRFDPIENLFRSSPTTFTSDLPLPTERQILYVAGQLEKFTEKYFEHIEDDQIEFKNFQSIVNGIVGKSISAIPIINFMVAEEKLVMIGDEIKLV